MAGAAMNGRVGVLDLASGEASERPTDTLTLDVPRDLPRTGTVSVDDGRRGRYVAADGHDVVYAVLLRPLRWRAHGETCLVARTGGAKRRTRQYRLSLVEPIGGALFPRRGNDASGKVS
jgi:hypothetical protein